MIAQIVAGTLMFPKQPQCSKYSRTAIRCERAHCLEKFRYAGFAMKVFTMNNVKQTRTLSTLLLYLNCCRILLS